MIYFTPRLVIYTLWLSSVALGARQLTNFSNNITTHPSRRESQEFIMELAIFCDYDFASQFQNDDQELLKYWSVVMQDVHLRFTSLQNVSVAFRLNMLIILESREEQTFIEDIRKPNGTLSSHDVVNQFARWAYFQSLHNNYDSNSFDIAVLAVGSPFANSSLGVASIGGVCQWTHKNFTVRSVLTITSYNPNIGQTLAHEIGHLLGAGHDEESTYKTSDCGNFSKPLDSYIMGESYENKHELLTHAFSPCSQKLIGKVLQSNSSSCLRNVNKDAIPMIDTALNCPQPEAAAEVAIGKHCQLHTKDTAAYVTREVDSCNSAKCHFTFPFGLKHTIDIGLLDGMACGTNGNKRFCFRGTCLSSGSVFMNVKSKQCIGNGNYFGVNDSPALIECESIKAANPMNALRLVTAEIGGFLITMTYQRTADSAVGHKCLKIDGGSNVMTFVDCASNSSKFVWSIERNQEHEDEFLLRHKFTNRCIMQNASELTATSNCSWENAKQRWIRFTGQESKCDVTYERANYIIGNYTHFVVRVPNVSYTQYYIFGAVFVVLSTAICVIVWFGLVRN